MQVNVFIPIGNKPLLLVLLYKELYSVLKGKQESKIAREQRLGAGTESGVEAEPEAEMETYYLQTAGCRHVSNT